MPLAALMVAVLKHQSHPWIWRAVQLTHLCNYYKPPQKAKIDWSLSYVTFIIKILKHQIIAQQSTGVFVSFKQNWSRYAVMGDSFFLVQATLLYYLLQLKCPTINRGIWPRSIYLGMYFSFLDLFAGDFSFSGFISRLVKPILFAYPHFAISSVVLLTCTFIWWTSKLGITTLNLLHFVLGHRLTSWNKEISWNLSVYVTTALGCVTAKSQHNSEVELRPWHDHLHVMVLPYVSESLCFA